MIHLAQGALRATLHPERGALVSSLQWNGEELLYLEPDTLADPSKNVRGGIPILFPLCGPDPEKRMPQHGLARQASWQVLEAGSEAATVALEANDETRAAFPFDYRVLFEFRLADDRLVLDQTYHNRGDQPMPFQTGLHPYFLVDPAKQVSFQLPCTGYRSNLEEERERHHGLAIDLTQPVDAEFDPIREPQASLEDQARRLRISVGYSREYTRLVVWNVPGKPFVCLEPWTGPRFGLRTEEDLLVVPPGGELKTSVWIGAERL